MFEMTFLGSGSAFTVGDDNYQSNILLEHSSGERLLIDCGTDIRFSLYEQGLTATDISHIFVSHLHADHTGGLEWLGLVTKFTPSVSKPHLFVSHDIADSLWTHSLSAGMCTLKEKQATINDFFVEQRVKNNFVWQSIDFKLVKTKHMYSNQQLMGSYGLFFTINHKNIFLTTDTQFIPDEFMSYYQQADIIFHDCELKPHKTCVHARYEQLVTLDNNIKAKTWLYHYEPLSLPDAQTDGFCGFIKKGQKFKF